MNLNDKLTKDAAKEYLKNPTEENRQKSKTAAYSAYTASDVAAYAAAAGTALKLKICKYGIKLLKQQ